MVLLQPIITWAQLLIPPRSESVDVGSKRQYSEHEDDGGDRMGRVKGAMMFYKRIAALHYISDIDQQSHEVKLKR